MTKRLLPIGPWMLDPQSEAKRKILSEECERYRWTVTWPVSCDAPAPFLMAAWLKKIANSTLVLADLSLERPSCYFELGCVEAMKKRVVVIATAGTPIHQTSHRDSVIFFDDITEYRAVVRRLLA